MAGAALCFVSRRTRARRVIFAVIVASCSRHSRDVVRNTAASGFAVAVVRRTTGLASQHRRCHAAAQPSCTQPTPKISTSHLFRQSPSRTHAVSVQRHLGAVNRRLVHAVITDSAPQGAERSVSQPHSLSILQEQILVAVLRHLAAHPFWPCASGCDDDCRSLAAVPSLHHVEWDALWVGDLAPSVRFQFAQVSREMESLEKELSWALWIAYLSVVRSNAAASAGSSGVRYSVEPMAFMSMATEIL